MKRSLIAAGTIAIAMAFSAPGFAQGPAKTPNGSMPAAPSSSMPNSGGPTMAGSSMDTMQAVRGRPMGMRRMKMRRHMAHKRMMHHRRMMKKKKKKKKDRNNRGGIITTNKKKKTEK